MSVFFDQQFDTNPISFFVYSSVLGSLSSSPASTPSSPSPYGFLKNARPSRIFSIRLIVQESSSLKCIVSVRWNSIGLSCVLSSSVNDILCVTIQSNWILKNLPRSWIQSWVLSVLVSAITSEESFWIQSRSKIAPISLKFKMNATVLLTFTWTRPFRPIKTNCKSELIF